MAKKVFYGWVVCAVSTLLLFVTMGTVSNGFSVFLPYIIGENGFTHAQGSSLVTMRCLVSFLAMLGIRIYYQKLSIRMGTGIAAACAGGSFLLYGAAKSYHLFCLAAAVSGLSYGFGSMIPVSILINKWFDKRRALALSICASGSGIATIVLPPVSTLLIERLSMRMAFFLEAVGIFGLTAVIFLFLRNSPAEMGLLPYGQGEEAASIQADKGAEVGACRTLSRKGWILMGCVSLFMGALANPGLSHLPVLYTTEGFDGMTVAGIISGVGAMITLGKLLYGQVTDKIGGYRSSLLFGEILLAGHVLCCLAFTRSLILCGVNVLCLGVGYPIATIGPSVWANDLSSQDRYPAVVRKLQVIYAAGALIFASVPGILADRFGSYIPAYLLFSVLLLVALLFVRLSYRKERSRREGAGAIL